MSDARKCVGCGQPFDPRKGMYWTGGVGPYHGFCLPVQTPLKDKGYEEGYKRGLLRGAAVAAGFSTPFPEGWAERYGEEERRRWSAVNSTAEAIATAIEREAGGEK